MNKIRTNEACSAKMVSFVQHDLPGLRSGKYKIRLSQQVESVQEEGLSVERHFAVGSDRFGLSNPGRTIYSVFPAEQASGRYDTVLPSVVFLQTTLPWVRTPLKSHISNDFDTLPATDKDIPTWLTILLLDEQDSKRYGNFCLEPQVNTVGDLFPPSVHPSSTLGTNHSYFDGASTTDSLLEPGQQTDNRILTLDIPMGLFTEIAPSVQDLKCMAHIRKVSLINKATMPGISDLGEPEGSFSIVFGNRLPGSNRRTYAYLVSLERLEKFLPTDSGPQPLNDGKMLRLAVLKCWDFYSTGDNAAFVDRLNRLNTAQPEYPPAARGPRHITTLHMPIPQQQPGDDPDSYTMVSNALSMGYLPMNHHLRSGMEKGRAGDQTVSWYKGPLSPYPVPPRNLPATVTSADQITLFDPTTGLFDVSYACAWALGRQLALQDKGFATQLLKWKRQVEQKVQHNVEKKYISNQFLPVFRQAFRSTQTANDFGEEQEESFVKQALTAII